MTNEQLLALRSEHSKYVTTSCDEMHAHRGECLEPASNGTRNDVVICRLVAQLLFEREQFAKFAEDRIKEWKG